ncbi:transcription factor 23 [Peromyscus eremicus]|uniref:transcription factor 23 n=1 Tax=Peromyscus eremicus TaxID=42410 RepID=UPI0027DD263E|nr:transcription factor 23 [Peromyscus eremicus]
MSQEATGVPAMPRAGLGQTKAKARLLLGTDRKRSRLSRTRQDLWDDTSWSNQRLNRATSAPRGTRAKGTAHGRSEASPENAARERTRVRTLRQAFLALQAALPAVPPDTKLSKLDVLVLATSYIAHLTRTLGHELPGPAWPPFLRGLRYLHPLKKWPMRSRLYAGGLGCSGLGSTTAIATSQRTRDEEVGSQVSVAADVLLLANPVSPAPGNKWPAHS